LQTDKTTDMWNHLTVEIRQH